LNIISKNINYDQNINGKSLNNLNNEIDAVN